jgi:gas vesicle protein
MDSHQADTIIQLLSEILDLVKKNQSERQIEQLNKNAMDTTAAIQDLTELIRMRRL